MFIFNCLVLPGSLKEKQQFYCRCCPHMAAFSTERTQGGVCADNSFFAEVFTQLLGIVEKCLSVYQSILQALGSRELRLSGACFSLPAKLSDSHRFP